MMTNDKKHMTLLFQKEVGFVPSNGSPQMYFSVKPYYAQKLFHDDTELNDVLQKKYERYLKKDIFHLLQKVALTYDDVNSQNCMCIFQNYSHFAVGSVSIRNFTDFESIEDNDVMAVYNGYRGHSTTQDTRDNIFKIVLYLTKMGYECRVLEMDTEKMIIEVCNSKDYTAQLQLLSEKLTEQVNDVLNISLEKSVLFEDQLARLEERLHYLELIEHEQNSSSCSSSRCSHDEEKTITLTCNNLVQEAIGFHKKNKLVNNDLIETLQAMLATDMYVLCKEITHNKMDFTEANTLFLVSVAPAKIKKNDLQNLIFKSVVCEDLI